MEASNLSSQHLDNEAGQMGSETGPGAHHSEMYTSIRSPPGHFYESGDYHDHDSNSEQSDDEHDPEAFLFGDGQGQPHANDDARAEAVLPSQSLYSDHGRFDGPSEPPRILTHDDDSESLYAQRAGSGSMNMNGSRSMGQSLLASQAGFQARLQGPSDESGSEDEEDAGPTQSLLMERGPASPPRGSGSQRKNLFSSFSRASTKRGPKDRVGFLRFLAGRGGNPQDEAVPAPRMNAPYSTLPHNRYDDGPTIRIDYAPETDNQQHRFLPREQSIRLWQQATISSNDLDRFLSRCYSYYVGKGMYCILLERVLGLIILAFVMWFSIFLFSCVDWSLLAKGKSLSDIMVPQCLNRIHGIPMIFIVLFWFWWISQCVQLFLDIPKLKEMYNFYTFLLEIPDVDVQSVSWTLVVSRLTKLPLPEPESPRSPTARPGNPSVPPELTALSIASRILRRENYWLPVVTQSDLVDLNMPVFGDVLTKSMEWNLWVAVFGWLFDKSGGAVRRRVREGGPRAKAGLVSGLKRRFILLGIVNFVFSPLIVGFVLLYFFFKYAEQLQKSPTLLNMRGYSRIAKWKFREFNEVPHYFHERLNRSHTKAVAYMDGFPKAKLAIVARFVTFISGSFAAVLALAAWLDEDLLLNFYITPGRSGLFYIGLFGAILAIGRALTPDPYAAYDPKGMMEAVARETHFLPPEWQSNLHADEVRREFSNLFQLKILLFVQEIMGIFWTPWILLTKMPENADRIVDFFVDNTAFDEAVGWVCRFALFDLGQGDAPADEFHYPEGTAKMEQSMLDFKLHNPGWSPRDMASSAYLSRVLDPHVEPVPPIAVQPPLPEKRMPPNGRVSVNALLSARRTTPGKRPDSIRLGNVGPEAPSTELQASPAPPSAGSELLDLPGTRRPSSSESVSASRYSAASGTMEGRQGVINVFRDLYDAGANGLL